MPPVASSVRDQLRQAGQADLGLWVEAATGNELWSVQRRVLAELSVPRSQIVVPSCNASGKTFLAARAALAFFDAYTPGAPCASCDPDGTKGGCRGSKILVTSSKETHLRDNLWGELRLAIASMANLGLEIPGTLAPADTFLVDSWGNHFIRGQVATKEEAFQGYHAAHKLIVGDEATSVGTEVSRGITSLQATADTRLLLIFNPTTEETYAAQMARSPASKVIKITAFDTPHFTGEHIPEGSNLTQPAFLEQLQANGMGPGSYEWTTRVLAEFWQAGDDTLIPAGWVHAAKEREHMMLGAVTLGIDFAPYGDAESTIAVRRGDNLIGLYAYPAGRVDHFINGDPASPHELSPIRRIVRDYGPFNIIYDADGVGAGTIGEWVRLQEWAIREGFMQNGSTVIPFRGGKKISDHYRNSRSAWWWALRVRFERGQIAMQVRDGKLDEQLSAIHYSYTSDGMLRVETKEEMRHRGVASPDRADAVMYAYALSGLLPDPSAPVTVTPFADAYTDGSHSDAAHWADLENRLRSDGPVNPVTGIPDEL